ncbi:serine/threonine protein kinase [Microvenator marinus]|uniref:Serine/threonine protein kinase n=1 Tax=Microvenator marinus TaxID=2600177 RepID=A0A5B8XTV4_9DELT|nr:serine/threonine-protein kinase [Microvenator marinus]QED27086.1 serine/threonine protein kinase [Microvenator marinus]
MSYKDFDMGTRYEFERILGRGGMGVVLRAKDTVLNRPVAVKILSEELAHLQEAQDIFLTEGQALASLKHPNLVSVFDVMEHNTRVMMVLEYVEGDNLDDVLRAQGNLDVETVIDIGMQLTLAIQYLHQNGFIHRDLKPANVMMQPGGDVKLIDFGLARSLEVLAERGTRVRGSPAYMAPEQFTGDQLSGATDIYALGVSLFELTAGRLPFIDGDNGFSHVHREPPKLADLAPGVPAGLSLLIDRCLAKTPSERPSPADVLSILKQLSLGEQSTFDGMTKPVLTTGAFESVEEPRSGKKRGLTLGLVAILALGVVASAGFYWSASDPAPQELDGDASKTTEPAAVAVVEVEESPAPPEDVERLDNPTVELALAEGKDALSLALNLSKSTSDLLVDAKNERPRRITKSEPELPNPKVTPAVEPKAEEATLEAVPKEVPVEEKPEETAPAVADPKPEVVIPIPALKPAIVQQKPTPKVEPKKEQIAAPKPKAVEKKAEPEKKETAEPLLSF